MTVQSGGEKNLLFPTSPTSRRTSKARSDHSYSSDVRPRSTTSSFRSTRSRSSRSYASSTAGSSTNSRSFISPSSPETPAKRWINWMSRAALSDWVPYSIFFTAALIRFLVALGGYSGEGSPPMHGDFEAQRHWMEITLHLPRSEWYYYDLPYWGLDYPPLTAYHSFLTGLIGQAIDPTWFALESSRGAETEGLKAFMRASVVGWEIAVWWTALAAWIYGTKRSSGSRRSKQLVLLVLLLLPPLILVDHGHFQYNTVMLGLALWTFVLLRAGRDSLACVVFVCSLCFKQMALYWAPAVGIWLVGKCWHLGGSQGLRLFVNLAVVTTLSFAVILGPFAYPHMDLAQVAHRVFPFARGIFEDKVANFWCATNTFIKWRSILPESFLPPLSLILTSLALLPSTVHFLYLAHTSPPGTDLRAFIPLLAGHGALSFFLFSFQVHEKTVLIPLLGVWMWMTDEETDGGALDWGVFWNNVAVFSMWPLLKRDGQILQYVLLTAFWNYLMGSFDRRMYKSPRPLLKFISMTTYPSILALHLAEYLLPPPIDKPDLYVVLNAVLCFSLFALGWLAGLKKMVKAGWAVGVMTQRYSKTSMSFSPTVQALIDEFHPPLSPTLIATISYDHDHTDPTSLLPVRETLQALASDTILSSDSNLDPDAESDAGNSARKYGIDELVNDVDGWSLDGSTKSDESSERTSASPKDNTPLGLLKAWFPSSSEEYLAEALAENPTDDLSQVVENLLSLEAIREAEERGSWGELDLELERELDLERELELGLEYEMDNAPVSTWDFMTQEERDESWMMGTSRPSTPMFADAFASDFTIVSKKKVNKKAKATTVVGSTRGDLTKQKKATVVPLASPITRPKSSAVRTEPGGKKKMVLLNRWDDFSTTSQTMSSLLSPFPQATPAFFVSYLHDPSYDTARSALLGSIDRILSELEPMEYPGIEFLMDVLFSSDDIGKNVEDGIQNRPAIEKVWQVCLGDFERAVDMWTILEGSKQRSIVKVSLDKPPQSRGRSSSETREEQEKVKDRKQIEVLPSVVAASESPAVSKPPSIKKSKPVLSKPAVQKSKPTGSTPTAPIVLTFPLVASTASKKNGSAPWSSSRPSSPLPRSAPGSRSNSPTRATAVIGESPSAFPLPSPIAKGTKARAQRTRTTAASVLAAPIGKLDQVAAGGFQSVEAKPAMNQTDVGLGFVGDYETLKRKELEALEKRKEALMQASRLFTSGSKSNRGGEVAGHYVEQARRYYDVSRRLALDVARAKLAMSNRVTPTWIDLHGLTAYQALRVVHERVQVWWTSGLSSTSHFSIVTGRGSHSAHGRSVLRPAVARSLVNDGWQISLGKEGMIVVIGAA
ncbi:Glucosyltransferase-Alg6p [Phaffia rhodozyma]|uniref:dolichyl-P-Glc:Man9GlcNAc2-PP-dolichol alpha-1,3-glucosyltransferase n=1 Tax=Phaffia rhodozyma TaxID=264483 RepID=A0A0F7SGK7_PHARH|nr:Glucosyltransferase-Alg6p [Phaffia rhodozyma]